jgi:hypothetical protein
VRPHTNSMAHSRTLCAGRSWLLLKVKAPSLVALEALRCVLKARSFRRALLVAEYKR